MTRSEVHQAQEPQVGRRPDFIADGDADADQEADKDDDRTT